MPRKKYPTPPETKNHSYDLKVCSVTKALTLASDLMGKKENFKIRFVNKKDESCHELEHSCEPAQFMTDDEGKKWKRVYE